MPLELALLGAPALLPQWYMPPTVASLRSRRWRWLAVALVVCFLAIEATGLCSTYGSLVIP